MRPATLLCFTLVSIHCSCDSPARSLPSPSEHNSVELAFGDASLDSTVRRVVDKADGELTTKDFLSVTRLTASGSSIRDLGGIEQLTSLTSLDLSDNEIRAIDPISSLVQLVFLDLENNHIANLSPLANLKNLAHLAISFNSVTDISPLLGLSQLASLELSGNPLGAMAPSHISQLRRQGVTVYLAASPIGGNSSHRFVVFDSNSTGSWAVFVLAEDIEINLTESPNADMQPDLSPDGSKIVLRSKRNGGDGLYTVEANGGNPVRLVQFGGHPSWSPQGKRIAFTDNNNLYVLDADGTNKTTVASFGPEAYMFQRPAWAPDGRKIALLVQFQKKYRIYVIDLEADHTVYLIHEEAYGYSAVPSQGGISWSPDGSRITFVAAEHGQQDVFTANADGSNRMNLTKNPARETDSAWSPDGQKIAFVSEQDRASEIHLMGADGSNPVRLTSADPGPGGPLALRWSADGRVIAFLSSGSEMGQARVQSMNADGTGRVTLTNSVVFGTVFSWR